MAAADDRRNWPSKDVRRTSSTASTSTSLTAVQLAVGFWLIVSPFVLTGPNLLVGVKDLVAGTLLLVVSIGACLDRRVRAVEGPVCLVLGVLLISASIALEFGSGSTAAARQWNEVVVGVVLIYVSTARVR